MESIRIVDPTTFLWHNLFRNYFAKSLFFSYEFHIGASSSEKRVQFSWGKIVKWFWTWAHLSKIQKILFNLVRTANTQYFVAFVPKHKVTKKSVNWNTIRQLFQMVIKQLKLHEFFFFYCAFCFHKRVRKNVSRLSIWTSLLFQRSPLQIYILLLLP